MMFHTTRQSKPWLIAGFALLLAIGVLMLLVR